MLFNKYWHELNLMYWLNWFGNHSSNFHLKKTMILLIHFCINTPNKCFQDPGVFVRSPFHMFLDFWTSGLLFRRMVVQLRRMAFINKNIASEGWTFAHLISRSSIGTPLFISFLGFTYIELQMDKLLPKCEWRFHLDGINLIGFLPNLPYRDKLLKIWAHKKN